MSDHVTYDRIRYSAQVGCAAQLGE